MKNNYYLFEDETSGKWKIAQGNAQSVESWGDFSDAQDVLKAIIEHEAACDTDAVENMDINWE